MKVKNYSSTIIKEVIDSVDPKTERRVENRMYISAYIKDLMDRKDLRNKDLAARLGKKPSIITRWLSGTHNFTLDTLSDIEVALGERVIVKQPAEVKYHFSAVARTAPVEYSPYSNRISNCQFARA